MLKPIQDLLVKWAAKRAIKKRLWKARQRKHEEYAQTKHDVMKETERVKVLLKKDAVDLKEFDTQVFSVTSSWYGVNKND